MTIEEMRLSDLDPSHQLRNTKISQLTISLVCRHTKSKRDPSTWKIKNNTYNQLNESWQNNFDWMVTKTK
jgi:ribonuclease HIII